jgi:hypothetical protein
MSKTFRESHLTDAPTTAASREYRGNLQGFEDRISDNGRSIPNISRFPFGEAHPKTIASDRSSSESQLRLSVIHLKRFIWLSRPQQVRSEYLRTDCILMTALAQQHIFRKARLLAAIMMQTIDVIRFVRKQRAREFCHGRGGRGIRYVLELPPFG